MTELQEVIHDMSTLVGNTSSGFDAVFGKDETVEDKGNNIPDSSDSKLETEDKSL